MMEVVQANPLVIEVDRVKTPDYVLIEELYGEEFRNEIQENVDYCNRENKDWKVEILADLGTSITQAIVFATSSYCYLYDVSLRRKKINDKQFIGRVDSMLVLKVMNSIKN
ncbi:hypothetical protein ACQCVK_04100 [Rossellomorea vietnamensis]|uniref:hypothetical protein n=1 Tax=Rossellomorea vietnamensis TaxID=218284 RepID=UPI003CE84D53